MLKEREINSVILAAGLGTRMKSNVPKVLHEVSGKPLLFYPIELVENLKVKKNIVVIGHESDRVRDKLKNKKIVFTYQEKQLGSADALKCALKNVDKNFKGVIIVLSGDTVLVSKETIKKLLSTHFKNKNTVTILTANVDDPFSYGRIKRNNLNDVESIIEEKDASSDIKKIKEVNSGVYCFNFVQLSKYINKINSNNKKKEYYLTDIIKILKSKGFKIGALKTNNSNEILGINNRYDLSKVGNIINKNYLKKLMIEGVTIIDSNQTYIESTVRIGRESKILPGSFLSGDVKIGTGCVIGPNTIISNTKIGNNTKIISSVINESTIGNEVNVGPFTHLRPNSIIKDSCKVGNFSEIKNSVVDVGSKISHLSYIGDAKISKDVNIGAGTITCNYDGKNKSKTIIEEGSFIGSNVNLVAPVKIGRNSIIGAGSTISDNVPESSLAIERAKQVNKLKWVKFKSKKKKK